MSAGIEEQETHETTNGNAPIEYAGIDEATLNDLRIVATNGPEVQLQWLLKSEHWLKGLIVDLLAAHQDGLDFDAAQTLLTQKREEFESDLAVAHRMYRTYPHLVRGEDYDPADLDLARKMYRTYPGMFMGQSA